ncbi:MAG: hypothetical protein WC812_00680 [Candidatus Pacearchaeota archaeon]|jgi:hypothetical protein
MKKILLIEHPQEPTLSKWLELETQSDINPFQDVEFTRAFYDLLFLRRLKTESKFDKIIYNNIPYELYKNSDKEIPFHGLETIKLIKGKSKDVSLMQKLEINQEELDKIIPLYKNVPILIISNSGIDQESLHISIIKEYNKAISDGLIQNYTKVLDIFGKFSENLINFINS